MEAAGEFRQVAFELDAPETAEALADRHLMEQVCVNLSPTQWTPWKGQGR